MIAEIKGPTLTTQQIQPSWEGRNALSLPELQELDVACVVEVRASDADADRLKALGLCVGRRVQVVQLGDPLIIRSIGIRLGLSKRLAKQVYVQPLPTGVMSSEACNS